MNNEIRKFVNLIISEARRQDVESVPRTDTANEIDKYVSDDNNPTYFVHFSHINKMGINPQSTFNTPLGIYVYPVTEDIASGFKVIGGIPFAQERPYAHIVKKNDGAKTVFLQRIHQEWFNGSIEKLRTLFANNDKFDEIVNNAIETALQPTLGSKWWNVTRELAGRDMKRWGSIMRKLGIDCAIDFGDGIIHENEPVQAVFFTKHAFEQVDVLTSPVYRKDKKYDQEDSHKLAKVKKLVNTGKIPLNRELISDIDKVLKVITQHVKSQSSTFSTYQLIDCLNTANVSRLGIYQTAKNFSNTLEIARKLFGLTPKSENWLEILTRALFGEFIVNKNDPYAFDEIVKSIVGNTESAEMYKTFLTNIRNFKKVVSNWKDSNLPDQNTCEQLVRITYRKIPRLMIQLANEGLIPQDLVDELERI